MRGLGNLLKATSIPRMARALLLPLVLLLSGSASPGSETGRLRFSPRRVQGSGGEVLLIKGARASEVLRVWFGETESPSTALVPGLGMAALVPSSNLARGEPGSRVPVRVELADGSTRRLGRLRVDGYPKYDGKGDATGGAFGFIDEFGVRHTEMEFSSWAKRIDAQKTRYTYEVRNRTTGVVRVTWATLELIGLPGGWEVSIGPESSVRLTLDADGPAVEGGRQSVVEGTFGSGINSWAGFALLPASMAPIVAAPENVTSFQDTDGSEVVQWTHPDPSSLDSIDVIVESAQDPEGFLLRLPPDTTSVRIPPELLNPGLNGVAVTAGAYGFGSQYVLLGVVR